METNLKDKHYFKRGRNKKTDDGVGFAILLILIGGIFLFLNLGIIPAIYRSVLLSWQMLLIAVGVWSLIRRNYALGGLLIIIGGIFIFPRLSVTFPDYFVNIDIDMKTYWPLMLIFLGILLVIRNPFFSRKHYEWKNNSEDDDDIYVESNGTEHNKADFIDKNIMFGSSKQIILSDNFRGGEANLMFGELVVDLRKALLADGNRKLEVNVMFGSAIIYVPSDWIVEMQNSTLFGSFEDKRRHIIDSPQEGTSRLIIKGSSIFGSGEIRS